MEVALDQIDVVVKELIAELSQRRYGGAAVVGLTGELGAGKTTFIQHVAQELGITEPITSPTFVIQKRYPISHNAFSNFIHIDAYRVTARELREIGFDKLTQNSSNIIFVEWADNVKELLPSDVVMVHLVVSGTEHRELTIDHAEEQ